MLSTGFSAVSVLSWGTLGISTLALIGSIVVFVYSQRTRASCIRWTQWLEQQIGDGPVTRREWNKLRGEVEGLAELSESTAGGLKRLRSAAYMRNKRESGAEDGGADGMPDPDKEPEKWKAAMRLKLHGVPFTKAHTK